MSAWRRPGKRPPPRPLWGERERLLARFLEGVGEVEGGEFRPSPFQEQALRALLEGRDVLVVAPTGSGKTWIAEQAIDRLLEEGRECWYTSPLKALSNQKFERFKGLYGAERVGLLTGERRENPSAPIIVATTEVLRNALYEGVRRPDLIVLDEAHYLGDRERGTTWEEVIVLAPRRSRLLLLSATISNLDELADWVEEVRGWPLERVQVEERPVPLRYGLLDRRYSLWPLGERVAGALPERDLRTPFDPLRVVETLGRHNLLPAIVFLPRRRDCDRAAREPPWPRSPGWEARQRAFERLAGENPYLWRHPLLGPLLEAGVASHHAGHLTAWKVAVEQMLAGGLLRAVFATTTLAAGLDVPARSVVLPTLTVRDEHGPRPITALEFHQMSGRAGRRGKDRVGFVLLLPQRRRDLETALDLAGSEPEPLRSAFSLAYYQVLNLLHRFGPGGTLEVLESSFYLYQRGGRKARRRLREEFARRTRLLERLGYLDGALSLTEVGRWALLVRHERSLIVVEMVRRGLYHPLRPSVLAGWMASLMGDRAPERMATGINLAPLQGLVEDLEALERQMGIDPLGLAREFAVDSRIPYRGRGPGEAWRRAAAVRLWAEGEGWDRVIGRAGVEEGDFQRLVLQTAEALREVEGLPFPRLTALAGEACSLLLREPVV